MRDQHRDRAATGGHRLNRREVAARLGISTSSVRRLEWDVLHPEQDDRGVWRFDPAEVARIEPRSPRATEGGGGKAHARAIARKGRLAALVFRMFARALPLPQIVILTKQPSETIRELYREWSMSLEDGERHRRNAEEDD